MPKYSKEKFLDYIRAFNTPDWEKQHSFYAKDVTLALPRGDGLPTFKGSREIKNHYGPLLDNFVEHVVPLELMIEEDKIFFMMETNFKAKKAAHGPAGFDCVPGDVIRVEVWALYHMEGDLMKTIVTNQHTGEFLGQEKTFEERIKESQSRADKELLAILYG